MDKSWEREMQPVKKYVPLIHAYFKSISAEKGRNHSMAISPHVKLLFVVSLK